MIVWDRNQHARGTERQKQGAGGPRDCQSDRQGHGRPQGKRNNSGQEAETGCGGKRIYKQEYCVA
eukprot:6175660-Pleurochrysis_carterae.AAC.3